MNLFIESVFKAIFNIVLKIVLAFMVLVFVYIATSALLMLFPLNHTEQSLDSIHKDNQNATIFIQHGLAHTNIVIDLSSSSILWESLLPDLVPGQESRQSLMDIVREEGSERKKEGGKEGKKGFLLIGWGDKDTYQSTPSWSDLKVSVAVRALFLNTPSALHVRYLSDLAWLGDTVIPLKINKITSTAIENRVLSTFRDSKPKVLSPGYDKGDRFYYSTGKYNIFNTCNTWTGDVLRQSGVAMSLWTPFSYNVIHGLSGSSRRVNKP